MYAEKVVPALEKALNHSNPHNVPNLEKIVISSGIRSENSKEWVQEVVKEIAKLAGQQPVITKSGKRRYGDIARRAHVGIPLQVYKHRASVNPRLPRRRHPLGRPWQLQLWRGRPHNFPRNYS